MSPATGALEMTASGVPAVSLRAALPDDEPFLYRVYASTRSDELAVTPWTEEQKRAFLSMQFKAQHRYYHQQFPQAAFQLIERDGELIGRLYLDRRRDEIRVIDIALLPEHRNAGIGGALMAGVLDEGRAAGKPVRIHVEQHNPAMGLYRRLGFRPVEDQGVYQLLEWLPDAGDA